MKLLNIREGFACNSSSTHSIIFVDKPMRDDDIGDGFGWEYFTAASKEAKQRWLAATVYSNLTSHALDMDEENAKALTAGLCGFPFQDGDYVDHQSLLALPNTWSGIGLDIQFIREFCDWVLSSNAIIYGGNDNDEDPPTPPNGDRVDYRHIMLTDASNAGLVCRKDSSGYWTLFNRKTGDKVRFAFKAGDIGIEARKADVPELIDLKITDYCPYDCPACYQGSTRQGKHANAQDVYGIIRNMGEARVFETAIGGGEPTLHPEFVEIINKCVYYGVIPNFTTKDPKWFLRYPEVVDKIGAYAVSCDNIRQAEAVWEAIDTQPKAMRDKLQSKLTIQHVVGLAVEFEVRSILKRARDRHGRVVLLGYKDTHRGANVKAHTPNGKKTWGDWLVEAMTRKRTEGESDFLPWSLGVDTVLANELKGKLPDYQYRLTTKEGQFSCYIDATASSPVMHASSFTVGSGVRLAGNPDADWNTIEANPVICAWREIAAYEPKGAYVYKTALNVM